MNITARRIITLFTIQCAWPNSSRTSRLTLSVVAAPCIALGVACWLLAGQFACSSSNNGAVELSWQLRPSPGPIADGNTCDPFVCCDPGQVGTRPISRIQLDWQVGAGHGPA